MTQQEPLPMFDFSDAVGSYAQGEAGAWGATTSPGAKWSSSSWTWRGTRWTVLCTVFS